MYILLGFGAHNKEFLKNYNEILTNVSIEMKDWMLLKERSSDLV